MRRAVFFAEGPSFGIAPAETFLTTFRREMEIAKRYSDSTALNALHYLSYRGISSIYLLINSLGGRRGNT